MAQKDFEKQFERFQSETLDELSNLNQNQNHLDERMRAAEHKIESLPSRIRITAQQVTIEDKEKEAQGGNSESLLSDIMSRLLRQVNDSKNTLDAHKRILLSHGEEISNKAEKAMEALVQELVRDTKFIKNKVEEQVWSKYMS